MFAKNLPDKIKLPGILQAQGYGDDISMNTPWVLTLGDAWWKLSQRACANIFSQPGHVEVPFLAQPPKASISARRGISATMKFRRLAGPSFHAVFWKARATGKARSGWMTNNFPQNDSLSAPHITDLGMLTPGKHRLNHPRGQPPANFRRPAIWLTLTASPTRWARRGTHRWKN